MTVGVQAGYRLRTLIKVKCIPLLLHADRCQQRVPSGECAHAPFAPLVCIPQRIGGNRHKALYADRCHRGCKGCIHLCHSDCRSVRSIHPTSDERSPAPRNMPWPVQDFFRWIQSAPLPLQTAPDSPCEDPRSLYFQFLVQVIVLHRLRNLMREIDQHQSQSNALKDFAVYRIINGRQC